MGLLTFPYTMTAGELAQASKVQGDFDAIATILNGAVDADNLADGAVTQGKLATDSVTTAKIADGTLTNSKIASAAAIALSKLAAVTASRALVSDSGGAIVPSAVTAAEVGYLDGVTSAIQTQLNGKQANIAVTANRALASNGSGAVAASAVTATELGYLDGVTSAVQDQLDSKIGTSNVGAVHAGYVNSDASAHTTPAGWLVAHVDTGRYLVRHDLGVANVPMVTSRDQSGFASILSWSPDLFEIICKKHDGTNLDTGFTFAVFELG